MEVPEEILLQACTTDCPRYAQGTCPFFYPDKEFCPRVKEIVMRDEIDSFLKNGILNKNGNK